MKDYNQHRKYERAQDHLNFLSKDITDRMADERTAITSKLMGMRYNGQPEIWKPNKFVIVTLKGPKIDNLESNGRQTL